MWFRRDLRLGDHPALLAAAAATDEVLPLFVLDPSLLDLDVPRSRRLVASVAALDRDIGGSLVVRSGDPADVVVRLAAEVGATEVHVTRETTPNGRRRDERVARTLAAQGRRLVETGTPYAVSPGLVVTRGGTPYQVFTPFARAWREHGRPQPAQGPARVAWFTGRVHGNALPTVSDCGAGEAAALKRWRTFLETGLTAYDRERDRPDLDSTSRLSVPLKFGELHPRTLLADVDARAGARSAGADRFVTELVWREFYADVLWHRPESAWHDLRSELSRLPYDSGPGVAALVDAWQRGLTGYPFVDAGMRQLAAEGWMHNRLRMVTASFLTKDLHVWWPVGARHFLDHLLDGDLASNNHGWQWVAGTGTDAAPYFRVFNPVTQGRTFDPAGDYVRRWVPELAHLTGPAVHEPWRHPDGYAQGYPERVVDHDAERREAVARYHATRSRPR
jgi:deoxyribodipyrimidine photo-lyase